MNNRKGTTRRDDITNVRALAIFLVVLGHSIIRGFGSLCDKGLA